MYKGYQISVSVPAYNEEKHIKDTLQNIPKFVDLIVVVDDKSKDNTIYEVKECIRKDKRIHLISSDVNLGLGETVIKAHVYALKKGVDIVVVMAGDNQMDPQHLPFLLNTLIKERLDLVKGNRFFHSKDLKQMPLFRIVGNIFLTFIAKFCTGYWSIADPINGYTALRMDIFKKINLSNIGSRYGFEPSLLIELALLNGKVKDVFIPARYGSEKSKVNLFTDPLNVIQVLVKGFLRRMFYKYTIYNFHPIALFFGSSLLLILFSLVFGIYVAVNSFIFHRVSTPATVMLFAVPFILGVQFLLQAIVLDIQNEPK